ncbi:MAG: ATP-binding protein [Bacteroidales bacterium]|nr:ATP-binding protein [Bacteroidales bacterium]
MMKTPKLKYFFVAIFTLWFLIILSFFLTANNEIFTIIDDHPFKENLNSNTLILAHKSIEKHSLHLLVIFFIFWLSGNILMIISYLYIKKRIDKIKQKEQLLIDNEEKFRKYFQNNLAAMMLIDPLSKNIVDANNATLKLYGYSKQEILQKSMYDINLLPPDEIDKKMKKAIVNKSNYLSFQHKIADGSIKDVEVYASPFTIKNKKLMSIIVHDITDKVRVEKALKKSREKYKNTSKLLETLFNAVPDVIGIHDMDYNVISYNKAAYKFLNKTPKEVTGKKCYELLGCSDVCDKCVTKKVYQTKKVAVIESFDKKSNKWLELRGYPVFNEKGELYQVIEHIRDITERKKFIEELKNAKEKAEESERLKSSFLANMSHEIRTPMNAILGFAQLLMQEGLSLKEMQKYIDIITNSGNHLLKIINDIIDISKIDAKQLKINKSQFDLNKLLGELNIFFNSLLKQQKKSNIQLIIKKTANPVYIFTDRTRLNQVFINLVGNAIKFTESGTVELSYTLKENKILFSVKDTGIGMTKEELNFVFDRFRQGDETNRRMYGGTGLGLSISKEFIELLGGSIFVESKKGKGSTFYFTIPYENRIQEKHIEPPKKVFQAKSILKNKTVLIVEDDIYSQQILIEILKPFGINILTAYDSLEALQICKRTHQIDIVLMDLQLPKLDGLEATKRIKKIRPDLVIIAQTANAMPKDKEKSLAAGCNDYISKPIDTQKIIDIISKYIT